jgi:hypothetical protein
MPSTLIPSNALLLAEANFVRSVLNSGHSLRLFSNDFLPDAASALGDFEEAFYGGYARRSLVGSFGAPTKVQDGQYQIQSEPIPFECTSSPTATVYGCFVTDGLVVKYSCRFAVPIVFSVGTSRDLQVTPTCISTALI